VSSIYPWRSRGPPHPLQRASRPGQLHLATIQGGEGLYSHSEVRAHSRHEEEGLKGVSPEPKDYGGSDYSYDRSPS
jgi:hypothetical protein